MAGNDPKMQLLSLIRTFATEKSQGERRVVGLTKRIEELISELDGANLELQEAKQAKELTEQELRGYEVQLAMSKASIQTLGARTSLIQGEISGIGSDLEALKNEEGALRDEFINRMLELNHKIRKLQETITCNIDAIACIVSSTHKDTPPDVVKKDDPEVSLSTLEDMLANFISQTAKEEEEYLVEQDMQKKLQLELSGSERRVSVMDVLVKETKALQDLTRNVTLTRNKQTSQLEATYTSLSEELQRKFVCPRCHTNNMKVSGGAPQATEGN